MGLSESSISKLVTKIIGTPINPKGYKKKYWSAYMAYDSSPSKVNFVRNFGGWTRKAAKPGRMEK